MRLFFTLIAFLIGLTGFTQDTALYKWNVSSKKIDASTYELQFTTDGAKGWQLYAPNQFISDVPAAELVFTDSSITVEKPFTETGNATTINSAIFENTSFKVYEGSATFSAIIKFKGEVPAQLMGAFNYTYGKGEEFYALVPYNFSVPLEGGVAASSRIHIPTIDLNNPVSPVGGTGAEGPKSLWRIFLLGILGGLLGLVMPCTFPMIPSTIGFFTKQSGNRKKAVFNAFMYGFFIFLIYVLLSVPFYFIDAGNSNILNNISTNPWLNIFFALVFFVFALSFFGLFEIGLSGNLSTKVDSKANVKTLGGIFFMALTLAIVSFSCTGPILGTLLVGALNEDGGAFQLTIAMAGFGLALGLPFGLFALFPRWLSSLPRSGNWMNTVKIVFAFVELALMVKFLSNADLVMQWGLIKREVFFAAWIILGILTTLYLFGILKVGHDGRPKKLGLGRIAAAVAFGAFTVYLIPGLTNTKAANRPLISGFPPPLTYSIYGHDEAKGKGVEPNVVNDYEKAVQMAKQANKPLLIDFTGWACVNCREMEENVWTQKEVRDLIQQNFILVSLYVDDRKTLPAKEQQVFVGPDGSKKSIKTIGDKYATLQSVNFKNASQPLYAILSPDERLLNLPVGYMPDAQEYADWLRSGIKAHDELRKQNVLTNR
ncbi:MAG TPA: thioredoxin family protein [Chitinophagaceae bacterium]|nr:thioredoxin family protein [Chitinophagaceae bacterium]